MLRSPRLQLDSWLAKIKDKLHMNNKSRFMLLLLFFNGLLVVILLLSVRNQETRQRISRLDQEITHRIEQLTTRRANRTRIVYLTATPSSSPPATTAPVTATPTHPPAPTAVAALPTPTRRPNTPTPAPTSTPTQTPTLTLRFEPTALPTSLPASTPTWTPEPTPTSILDQVVLVALPRSLPADGSSTSVIRATLLDETGAPYQEEIPVTFRTDRGTFWGAPSIVVPGQNGSAEAKLTSSKSAGVAHIQVQAGSLPASVSVTFEPGAPHTLDLSATPLSLNVGETAFLEAIVWDANQNHVADGTPVLFETTLGSLDKPQAATRNGTARSALTSLTPGTARVSASAGATTRNIEVQFISPMFVSEITPRQECNLAPVQVTITGAGLYPDLSARLGPWLLEILATDGATMTAIVPGDISVGIYDLHLERATGEYAVLPQAYQAQDCTSPDTTLTSGFLGTYGAERDFASAQGDDDQRQVLFFEVPQAHIQPLYIRIYDPDCGGELDIQNGQAWDTSFSFVLYGASGAYTDPDARSPHPNGGATSGLPLHSITFAQDDAADQEWYNIGPLDPSAGERVGDKRVFKLVVAGLPGKTREIHAADLNLYNVALSTSNTENTAPAGARIWAYSWTYMIPPGEARTPPRLYPYVGRDSSYLVQNNWDFDRQDESAGLEINTPTRRLELGPEHVSTDNNLQFSSHAAQDTERGTTWTLRVWADSGQQAGNLVTFWATDASGQAMPLFARSTALAPP